MARAAATSDRSDGRVRRARRASAGAGALAALSLAAGADAQSYSAETIYLLRCSGCHGLDGVGSMEAGVPPFPGFVGAFVGDEEGRLYVTHVPGVVGSGLDDAEIAIVLNYIIAKWADEPEGAIEPFTAEEVAALRAVSIADVVGYRRGVVARLTAEGVAVADYPWP